MSDEGTWKRRGRGARGVTIDRMSNGAWHQLDTGKAKEKMKATQPSTPTNPEKDKEENQDDEAPKTFKGLLTDFFGSRFSAHAIPRVANSRSTFRRIIWAVISVSFIVCLGLQIEDILTEYYKYPKQVTIEVVEIDEVQFPSVTVCNFNVAQLSKVKNTEFESLAEQEVSTESGDCSDYEADAPWVVYKDYKPFTADEYWTLNNLNSGGNVALIAVLPQENTTAEPTTESPTTTEPSTTEETTVEPTTTEETTTDPTNTTEPLTTPQPTTTELPTTPQPTTTEPPTTPQPTTTEPLTTPQPTTTEPPTTTTLPPTTTPPPTTTTTPNTTLPHSAKTKNGARRKREVEEAEKDTQETLVEYKGYKKTYDERSDSYQWCRGEDDCLETLGLENEDKYNFTRLLQLSKRADLSDIRGIFTPTATDISDLGVLPQKFIISCTFDKKDCSFKDFYVWQSDSYGNCFTFNSPNLYKRHENGSYTKDNYIRNTTKAGYRNGLRLTLNLDTRNYVSLLSPDLGVRVVVHRPSVTPIPEEEGMSAPPGFLTSIGLRMKRVQRIGLPHGKCQPPRWGTYPREYSQTACRMLCLEQRIQEECGCSNAVNDLLMALKTSLPRCNPTNLTQELCRQLEIKLASESTSCDCPPACDDLIYTPLVSMNQVNRKFLNLVRNSKKYYLGDDLCSGVENSTVRLHVYLESLQQELIKEAPAKTLPSLLSEIGGNLGLFIGLSLATLLELAEFVFDLTMWGCKGTCRCCCGDEADGKKRPITTPVTPIKVDQDPPPDPAYYQAPSEVRVDGYYNWRRK